MDDDTAERRVRACIDAAINLLRLFIDAHRTRECRRADKWGPAPDHSSFARSEDGSLGTKVSRRGAHAPGYENWAECLQGEWGALLGIASLAVFGLLEPKPSYPLQARFLDALKWFGEGACDESRAARIVKYVFAWERLVITRDHTKEGGETLTAAVCGRVHLLADRTRDEPRGEELMKEIKRIYDVRSRLVHGSASPWDDGELWQYAQGAERITTRLLLAAILHYVSLDSGGGSDKDLEESFS